MFVSVTERRDFEDNHTMMDSSMTGDESDIQEWRMRKKTRRGKKKRRGTRNATLGQKERETPETANRCSKFDLLEDKGWNGTNNSALKEKRNRRYKKSRQNFLRPRFSPKAPHNSNQFLMDDRLTYSHDFTNLDSPDVFGERMSNEYFLDNSPENGHLMDFEASFYQDSDTKDFMIRDFEEEYRHVRFDQLKNFSKTELMDKLLAMEKRAEDLEKKLDRSPRHEDSAIEEKSAMSSLSEQIELLKAENARLSEKLNRCDDMCS